MAVSHVVFYRLCGSYLFAVNVGQRRRITQSFSECRHCHRQRSDNLFAPPLNRRTAISAILLPQTSHPTRECTRMRKKGHPGRNGGEHAFARSSRLWHRQTQQGAVTGVVRKKTLCRNNGCLLVQCSLYRTRITSATSKCPRLEAG